jgi:hypothetical protein
MDSFIECYADSARGVYIPQYFAESAKREFISGVSEEQFAILESGPDAEFYWGTWSEVLDSCVITDSRGKWYLYQDGDLFICHTDYLPEYDDCEKRQELIDAVNEYCADYLEYETTHKDSGDNYAHMPRECWHSPHDANLAEFIAENNIDAMGLDIDQVSDIALDNFSMVSGHIYQHTKGDIFTLEAFPISEIECQIDYAALTKSVGWNVNRNHILQIARDVDCHIGNTDKDSCLAYMTTDSVWFAEISAKELQTAIRDSVGG